MTKATEILTKNRFTEKPVMMAMPIMLLVYAVIALVAALGWISFLGNVMFGLGFAANTFFMVKWAHKKWMPGIICTLIVLATIIVLYAAFVGAIAA